MVREQREMMTDGRRGGEIRENKEGMGIGKMRESKITNKSITGRKGE